MFDMKELQEFTALDPIVSDTSTTLILMSMPSVEAHKQNFYFADPSNRFWTILSVLYDMPAKTKPQCLALLEKQHIALWSVIQSCLRYESREDTMQDIVLNDIPAFLAKYPGIQHIICISHDTLRLLQEVDPKAAAMAVYVPSASAADLWYDSIESLIPEYAKALGVSGPFKLQE